MKRGNAKWTAAVLGCVLCLTSCALSGNSPADGSKNTGDGLDMSKTVNIEYVVLGDPPQSGQESKVAEKWNAILKKKINTTMTLKWIEWSDWMSKYNLLLASGEPVDLITTGDWLDVWGNVQLGAFRGLNDILEKYAPQTYAAVPKAHWQQCSFGDQVMFIPEDQFTQWVNHGVMYRGDWAREFGITKPLETLADLEPYFDGIRAKKPGVIPVETDGMTLEGFYWGTESSYICIDTIFPMLFYVESVHDTHNVVIPAMTDAYMDFAKMMKRWGDKGFWPKDQLNNKNDFAREMINGKMGARLHHTNTYKTFRTQMDRAQPGSDLQFAIGQTGKTLVEMSIMHGGTAIGAHSRYPERALMVYDLLRNDEELYRLLNYGIEGVQYVIRDGRMQRPSAYNQKTDEYYSDFWGGRVDRFELRSPDEFQGIYDIYKRLDAMKNPYPFDRFVFNKKPVETELSMITNVVSTYQKSIGLGLAGDPESAVATYRNKLKAAGLDKVVREIRKQLDEQLR